MIYRELGNTGLRVSEIGIGCEGFIGKDEKFTTDMFAYAFEHGVNCMDLYSPNPEMHQSVGKAIFKRRGQFVLQGHLCTVWKDNQYSATRDIKEVKNSFQKLLKNLNTDYIDVGMIHYVDGEQAWRNIVEGGIMNYASELKKNGKIRRIGMSSHNPVVALQAVNSGLIEVLMLSVNPCYDLLPGDEDIEKLFSKDTFDRELLNIDPVRKELYETCQKRGIGITVMKAFAGGELLTDNSPAGKALTVNQCIHYALTRPAVCSVMSGVRSLPELIDSIAYEYASDEERDYASVFASFPKISWSGHCMYCGHCAPCHKNINVALLTKFLNIAKAQDEVPETVREHYAAMEATAKDCVGCGACESRCPFFVPIRENVKKALVTFGK